MIGAGPAGLAFAMAWPGATQIVEQAQEVGGLCRSIEFGGALFDIGGHCFHTPHADVAALVGELMAGRWEEQKRDARVAFGGEWIDYPFQQHVDQVTDPIAADACRHGGNPDYRASAGEDFGSWIIGRFGAGVAAHFMAPYNRKLWARDLRGMSCEWVGERIAGAAAVETDKRAPLIAGAVVGYPATGGFAEIFRAMARQAGPVAFGRRVVAIDTVSRTMRCADGNALAWDRLVSTMALPQLLTCLADCPEDLCEKAARLEAVSLKIVMISAAKAADAPPHRIYSADPEVPAHKIVFNHRSSTALKQRPREAVVCEVSYAHAKPPPDDVTLERTMIDWLISKGLIGADRDAIYARTVDVPLAYPVPTPERAAIVDDIRAYLAQLRIYSIGRFGGWTYANSDGCIKEAMVLADRLSQDDSAAITSR